jgi:membrane protease YdiL (CAAX protease family)
MKTKINFLAIVTFYTIAISLRYLTNKTPLLDGLPPGFLKVILQGIGPAIGALVAFVLFKIKPDLSLRGNYIDTASAFLLYWALALFLILGVEYVTKGTCSVLGVTAVLIYGLLEELGWRGFLQQQCKEFPEALSVLIIATLWFVWHLNFEMTTSNLMFFGILLLGSWGIGKVADRTHSLLAVSAFHSLNNFFPHMNSLRFVILMVLLSTWVISLVIRKRELQMNTR